MNSDVRFGVSLAGLLLMSIGLMTSGAISIAFSSVSIAVNLIAIFAPKPSV